MGEWDAFRLVNMVLKLKVEAKVKASVKVRMEVVVNRELNRNWWWKGVEHNKQMELKYMKSISQHTVEYTTHNTQQLLHHITLHHTTPHHTPDVWIFFKYCWCGRVDIEGNCHRTGLANARDGAPTCLPPAPSAALYSSWVGHTFDWLFGKKDDNAGWGEREYNWAIQCSIELHK